MIDPISVILAALAVGAAESAKEVGSEALKDTYNGLKKLIQRKITDKSDAELLDKYEAELKALEASLKDVLTKVSADKDKEIIGAAGEFLNQVNKYNITIMGNAFGTATGDSQHVEMTFELPDNKTKKGE